MSTQAPDSGQLPKLPVFDLHCDTLDRIALGNSSVYPGFTQQNELEGIPLDRLSSLHSNDAHVSLLGMKDYAWCQCFAIFVPDVLQGEDAWGLYQQVKNLFEQQCGTYSGEISAIRHAKGIPAALEADKCAALLTVEGASFFTDSLAPLDDLEADGVKMVTLTWNAPNKIASGSQTHEGFSALGKQVVAGLENRRMVVDVSHLNDEGFAELLTFCRRPFAASHSNSRAICHHPRNLTDDQFRAICDRGGIVGLNFHAGFITTEKREPKPEDFLRHLDHWLELGGEKAISLGSDYDGCDVPLWLKPSRCVSVLYEELTRAFGDAIAQDIFFNNACDFFMRNEKA